MPEVTGINVTASWVEKSIGDAVTLDVVKGARYLVLEHIDYMYLDSSRDGTSEASECGIRATSGANTIKSTFYVDNFVATTYNKSTATGASNMLIIEAQDDTITFQRWVRGRDYINNGKYGLSTVAVFRVG